MADNINLFRRRCDSAVRAQIKATKFLLKYDGWQSYATDHDTVEMVCALANLGVAKVNQFDQFALASQEKAERWLRGHDHG